jgi:hypothetical protein
MPEYTAELSISGRIEVIVLIALGLRSSVNVWMERRRLKLGILAV